MRARSIRSRLLLSTLAAAAIVWLLSGALAYLDARHEVDELLDAHLAQAAMMLLAQIGHEAGDDAGEIDTEHVRLPGKYGRRVLFQVWLEGRELALHSLNAPNRRLSARDSGFDDVRIDGIRWRVYSSWDPDRELLVQIAEDAGSRADIATTVARSLLLPVALGLVLLGLLLAWSIARSLRPLTALSTAVGRRAPAHLAPVRLDEPVPAELQPLIDRLNRLLEQLGDSLERERRLTADAAHELRTPIAALRAQAQVARSSHDDRERDQALAQVVVGCDRAARLVEQLLSLARVEGTAPATPPQAVLLAPLAAQVIADLAPQALSRRIELELVDDARAAVDGHPELLRSLLRNLVDNAIRYSPAHTTVTVSVRADASGVALEVRDQGPGVPEHQRHHLGERFRRLDHAAASGSGLGLSIVRRIAELHRATLSFGTGDAGRGLRVGLHFPPAGAPPRA